MKVFLFFYRKTSNLCRLLVIYRFYILFTASPVKRTANFPQTRGENNVDPIDFRKTIKDMAKLVA